MENTAICLFCSEMVDYEENYNDTTGEVLCPNCGSVLTIDNVKVIEDEIFTIKCVALTNQIGFDSLKKMIEFLGGSTTSMTYNNNGKFKLLLDSEAKLLRSLKLKAEELAEITFEAEFFAAKENMPKETIIAEIFNVFPLCVIREENSKYFIASNKGLANLISNDIGDDVGKLYSQFITGFEKATVLSFYLSGLKNLTNETMVAVEQSLIVANELIEMKTIPYKISENLASVDSVIITNSANDPGTEVSFSVIAREFLDDDTVADPVICSVRGIGNYLIKEIEDEDK